MSIEWNGIPTNYIRGKTGFISHNLLNLLTCTHLE